MPLTNAQKQRRYREKRKNDLLRDEEYKKKEKLRNQKRKKVADLTEREKRNKRKVWAEQKAASRRRLQQHRELTPPDSVEEQTTPRRGRKVLLRNRARCYRMNDKLKNDMEELQKKLKNSQKKTEALRKKLERYKKKEEEKVLSPKSKTNTWVRKHKINDPTIKRKLFEHNVLVESLRSLYTSLSNSRKKVIGRVVASKVVQKYKMVGKCSQLIGLTQRKRFISNKSKKISERRLEIKKFFIDESFSTAGKRETVTKRKEKKQKRVMKDTMKELHKKFCATHQKVSYTTFTLNRPFYVIEPKVDQRETCRCVTHENIRLLLEKMKKHNLIDTANSHEYVRELMCDSKNIKCAYSFCSNCSNREYSPTTYLNKDEIVSWYQWQASTKEYLIRGEKKVAKTVEKTKISGSLDELLKSLNAKNKQFKKHVFNISKQNAAYRLCKANLNENDFEGMLLMDFSENYNCKHAAEIQSFHFGGSRKQVSLHTSVFFHRSIGYQSFCTISPNLDHGPEAIWAHLSPVLKWISKNTSNVSVIHFFSDGPFSQYRQKKNFYLMLKNKPFHSCTWNFFESGHGKGEADGIGGAVKRLADQIVAHGNDIKDAQDFFEQVSSCDSKIMFFYIDEIPKVELPDLIPVKGTASIHQIVFKDKENIYHRPLSCFCESNKFSGQKFCDCFSPYTMKTAKLVKTPLASESSNSGQSNKKKMQFLPDNGNLIMEPGPSKQKEENIPNKQVSPHSLKVGTYVIVIVSSGKGKKKKEVEYVAVCQEDYDDEDGEVLVMFMTAADNIGKLFVRDEKDLSYIKIGEVRKILEEPSLKIKGERIFQEFPIPIILK